MATATTTATTTAAEEFLRTVSLRIGLEEKDPDRVNSICLALEQEYVMEDWQLAALDALQWKELGAPIGLAVAVRTLAAAAAAAPTTTTTTTTGVGGGASAPPGGSSSCTIRNNNKHFLSHMDAPTTMATAGKFKTTTTSHRGVFNGGGGGGGRNEGHFPSMVSAAPSTTSMSSSSSSKLSRNDALSVMMMDQFYRPMGKNSSLSSSSSSSSKKTMRTSIIDQLSGGNYNTPPTPPSAANRKEKGGRPFTSLQGPIVETIDEESGFSTHQHQQQQQQNESKKEEKQQQQQHEPYLNHSSTSSIGKQQQQEQGVPSSPSKKNKDTRRTTPPPKSDLETTNPPTSILSIVRALRDYNPKYGLFGNFFGGRPFSMTTPFQRAMIHSKSGAELKAHTVFVMELNVLAAALFLGAAVELWGSFPMDAVMVVMEPSKSNDDTNIMIDHYENGPYVPKTLALIYHFICCSSVIVQLAATAGWIWSIHVTAAVSPNQFHTFFHQTNYAFEKFMLFSETGQVILILVISLLLGANISATSSNPWLRNIGYYVPVFVLTIGCRFIHTLATYLGRVAYHGLLLTDLDPEIVAKNTILPYSEDRIVEEEEEIIENTATRRGKMLQKEQEQGLAAKKIEMEMARRFHSHNIISEGTVLDAYCGTNMLFCKEDNSTDSAAAHQECYSTLDFMLPGRNDQTIPTSPIKHKADILDDEQQ